MSLTKIYIIFCTIIGFLQVAYGQPAPPPPPPPPSPAPALVVSSNYGFLGPLIGDWVGTGANLVALPNFDSNPPSTGPSPFRLLWSSTHERLSFSAINGAIPNRGSIVSFANLTGQPDINIFGLQYRQDINQTNTATSIPQAIHTEVGTWLNVPATNLLPAQGPTLVRMATIPHGSSLLAQTFAPPRLISGPPDIETINSLPFSIATGLVITNAAYLAPYLNPQLNLPQLPTGITADIIQNPNLLLSQKIANQTILETIIITISTDTFGGIVNIPQVVNNANAAKMTATFRIELVQRPNGSVFLQLQYSQVVLLNFLGISWPHVSIGTLIKQQPQRNR